MWLMTAMAAWATPVAFQVSATVGRVDDPSGALSGSVQVGDTITMTYTYDTDTANTGSVPTVGDYWHDGPPYGMRVDAGPVSFATDPMATSFLVEFVNDHGNPGSDNYLLRSYANVVSRGAIASPVDHMSWQLDDSTMRALSSTALTTRPPALPDWTSPFGLSISGGDPFDPSGDWFVRATATSIRRAPAIRAQRDAAGQVVFDMTGATPRGQIAVLTAPSAGHTTVPSGGCAGLDTWLNRPTLRATLRADALGSASVTTTLPAPLTGQWVTIVDLATCTVAMAAMLP